MRWTLCIPVALKNETMEKTEKYLNVLCRLAFLFYWLFDNIQILVKVLDQMQVLEFTSL